MIRVSRYHKGGTGQQRDFFAIDESISFSVQYEEAFLIVMLLRHVIFCASIEGYTPYDTLLHTPWYSSNRVCPMRSGILAIMESKVV